MSKHADIHFCGNFVIFFPLRRVSLFPHEPRALPEVNRLALGGTVSPRETPSPSCHNTFAPANVDAGTKATTVLYIAFHSLLQSSPNSDLNLISINTLSLNIYSIMECEVSRLHILAPHGRSAITDSCLPVCGCRIKPNQMYTLHLPARFSMKEANSFTS